MYVMKKSPLKRKSKTELAKLKDKLWELCKQIVRKRDGNVCVTCNKGHLEGSNWQTGHFIPKASCGANLKYDLRNLASQCMSCNVHRGGEGAAFSRFLQTKYGDDFLDELWRDKNVIVKADKHYFLGKIEEYTELLKLGQKDLIKHTYGKES